MEKEFLKLILDDVRVSLERLRTEDTQTHRREYIKSVFSAIEGMNWFVRQSLLTRTFKEKLEPYEIQALMDETYSVDANGKIKVQAKTLPFLASLKMPVKLLSKYASGSDPIKFEGPGWEALQLGQKVRNRLMHPKTINDLEVSGAEIDRVTDGFMWMRNLAENILLQIRDELVKRLIQSDSSDE